MEVLGQLGIKQLQQFEALKLLRQLGISENLWKYLNSLEFNSCNSLKPDSLE
jgi:hypothetical protein